MDNSPEGRKPEKSLLYKFFANPYVQGVSVFIALAVAFSGKLDRNGTIVCIALGGIIGLFGVWSHIGHSVWRVVAMTVYFVAVVMFGLYLTAKPREIAINPADGSQPKQGKNETANSSQSVGTSQQSVPVLQPPSSTNSQTVKKQRPKKDHSKTAAETTEPAAQVQPTYGVTNPSDTIVNQNSPNYGKQTIIHNPPANPNKPAVIYDCDGTNQQILKPGYVGGCHGNGCPAAKAYETMRLLLDGAFEELKQTGTTSKSSELLATCTDEIKSTPEWLTPYLFCSEAENNLGDTAKAKEMLSYYEAQKGSSYDTGSCESVAASLRARLP